MQESQAGHYRAATQLAERLERWFSIHFQTLDARLRLQRCRAASRPRAAGLDVDSIKSLAIMKKDEIGIYPGFLMPAPVAASVATMGDATPGHVRSWHNHSPAAIGRCCQRQDPGVNASRQAAPSGAAVCAAERQISANRTRPPGWAPSTPDKARRRAWARARTCPSSCRGRPGDNRARRARSISSPRAR
jgi:hypothetical protein